MLISFIFTNILFINTKVFAQKIFFDAAKNISKKTLFKPRDLKVGDINGDGILDIVVASSGNDAILYFEGKGSNGEFNPVKIIVENFENAGIVILKDIDDDGDLDIVAGSFRDHFIAWYENIDGSGNFSTGNIISSDINGLTSLVTDDIDGDNDLDIIACFWEGEQIVYFKNEGGSFSQKTIIEETGALVSDIAFEDIDGDNKKDIISIINSGQMVYYKNLDGMGNFSEKIIINSNMSNPNSLLTTDIDNDGDTDIFCTTSNEIVWFKNLDGAGNFSDKIQILDYAYSAQDIISKDIDSDGDKDLVLGISERSKIIWVENTDGLGNFSDEKSILSNYNGAYAIGVADFDKNNTLDVCATSIYNHNLILIKNIDGAGNFDTPITLEESILNEPQKIIAGDFNADGVQDILIANQRHNNLVWYKNNNDGTFQHNIITADDGALDRVIAQEDFDGDGSSDIITSLAQGSFALLYWYKNIDGLGNFEQKSIQLKNYNNIVQIMPVDIDNDDDKDIILVSEEGNLISFLLNNGHGDFGVQTVLTDQTNHPNFIHVNDFDQDGDKDIVVLSTVANSIYTIKNNGQGDFDNPVKIMDTEKAPKSIISFDKDADGDIDLIYSSQDQNNIYWIENTDGQGNFSSSMRLSNTYWYGPDVIIGSDLDLDGDIDLVSMDKTYRFVDWQNNQDGLGNYSASIQIEKYINGLEDALVTDINGDSYPDILLVNSDKNALVWHENLQSPTFLKNPLDKSICGEDTITFEIDFNFGDSLRWEVKSANSSTYIELVDDDIYSGTKTKVLNVIANSLYLNGNQYRCIVHYKGHEFYSESALMNIFKFIESDAGLDDITCNSNIWLNGNNPSPGEGIWSIEAGNATILNKSDFSTKAENLSNGINIFRWTVINGICSDYDDVQITKNDSLKIINQPQNTEVIEGEDATLEVNIEGDITSYQWYKDQFPLEDGNNISGTKTSKLLVNDATSLDAGIYYCEIQGICNFITTDNAILTTINTTSDFYNNLINLYPNPVVNTLYIQSQLDIQDIIVQNIVGKELIIFNNKANYDKVDLSMLSTGIYFIKIKTSNKIFTHKIVKI